MLSIILIKKIKNKARHAGLTYKPTHESESLFLCPPIPLFSFFFFFLEFKTIKLPYLFIYSLFFTWLLNNIINFYFYFSIFYYISEMKIII